VFTDALAKKLEEYEQNRGKYPTLDSYYPELLKALDGFSVSSVKDLLNTDLTINGLSREARSVVYEIPDDERRADAVRFIERMHERFFSKLEMIDATKLDDAALKDKLKGNFILYTAMGEKARLFKATTQSLHIEIDGGTFRWNGVTAPVSDLRVILVGKNPYGDGNCVVYAAGCNRLLDGINGVFHGPCSYHIFQGDKLLKEGFYDEKSAPSSH